MDTSEFGIWAMFLFWASALGGIGLAIGWARMKGRNPGDRGRLRPPVEQAKDRATTDLLQDKTDHDDFRID